MSPRKRLRTSAARSSLGLGVVVLALGLATSGAASDAGGPYRNGLIAFVRCCGPAGIFVIREDGTRQRELYRPRADDAPLDPAWSPDGRQIAFVPGGPRGGLWVMGASGARPRRIVADRGDALFPSWSPRGRWIVFADLARRRARLHDLYAVRPNGSGLRRLTRSSADETHPTWAPSRDEIAYERDGNLWLMRSDGSRQRLLARDALSPSWSPAGTHLAFIRAGDPWVMARDGSGASRVVDLERGQIAVAWSPDGRWLVTAPLARGDLLLVRADGSETRQLTNGRGYGHAWPAWQRLPR